MTQLGLKPRASRIWCKHLLSWLGRDNRISGHHSANWATEPNGRPVSFAIFSTELILKSAAKIKKKTKKKKNQKKNKKRLTENIRPTINLKGVCKGEGDNPNSLTLNAGKVRNFIKEF